jgi:hypothetical protein
MQPTRIRVLSSHDLQFVRLFLVLSIVRRGLAMMSKRNFSAWNPSLCTDLAGFACSLVLRVLLVSQSSRTCERSPTSNSGHWILVGTPLFASHFALCRLVAATPPRPAASTSPTSCNPLGIASRRYYSSCSNNDASHAMLQLCISLCICLSCSQTCNYDVSAATRRTKRGALGVCPYLEPQNSL